MSSMISSAVRSSSQLPKDAQNLRLSSSSSLLTSRSISSSRFLDTGSMNGITTMYGSSVVIGSNGCIFFPSYSPCIANMESFTSKRSVISPNRALQNRGGSEGTEDAEPPLLHLQDGGGVGLGFRFSALLRFSAIQTPRTTDPTEDPNDDTDLPSRLRPRRAWEGISVINLVSAISDSASSTPAPFRPFPPTTDARRNPCNPCQNPCLKG